MPELAREALRAVAGALLHPAAARPQSITANGPGHPSPAPATWGHLPAAQAWFPPALGHRMSSGEGAGGSLPDARGALGGSRSPGKTPAQQILAS